MQRFIKNTSEAKVLASNKQLADALKLLDETFRIFIYEESEEPIVLAAEVITAVDIARKLAEKIVSLPEIEETDYIRKTLDEVNDAIANFLQDIIGPDDFWNAMVDLGRLLYFLQGVSDYLREKEQPIGENDNPAITIALSEDGSMQLYARLSDDGLSLEKAAELQEAFSKAMDDKSMNSFQMINLAGRLLTGQQFEEAIRVYENIILRYPEEAAQCLNAIGACKYYLGEYEKAIDFYMKALKAGELKSRVEYNVWESCNSIIEMQTERNEKMKWKFFFEEHFPNSEHEIEVDGSIWP
jgi:tetratricopeptide (TPR) repeat protein